MDLGSPEEISLPALVSSDPMSYIMRPADTTLTDSNLVYKITGLEISISVQALVEISVVGL